VLPADSAHYGAEVIAAASQHQTCLSHHRPHARAVTAAIAAITEDAWTPIRYPRAILDDQLGQWISDAEIPFTALAQTQSSPGSTTRTHRRDVSVSCPANGVLLVKAWESVKPWVGAGVSDVDDEDAMPAAVREEFGVDAGGVEP